MQNWFKPASNFVLLTDRFKAITSVVVLFVLCLGVLKMFVLFAPHICFHVLVKLR